MKHYIFILTTFASLYVNVANAQLPGTGQSLFLENALQPGIETRTTHPCPTATGWFVPYNTNNCFNDHIVRINAQTGLHTFLPVPEDVYPSVNINDIIQVGVNSFICAGESNKHPDPGPFYSPFIYKMDSNGNVTWQVRYHAIDLGIPASGSLDAEFTKVIQGPDGAFYALGKDHYIGKVDASGNKIWLKPFTDAKDIIWTSNGLLVAGNAINVLDSGGISVKKYFFSGIHFTGLQNGTGNTWYAIANNLVYTLDANMNMTDSFCDRKGYEHTNMNPIIKVTDSAYLYAFNDSLKSYGFNGKLNWGTTVPGGPEISGIGFISNQIAISGIQTTTTGPNVIFKTFDKAGNTLTQKRDIGIEEIIPSNYNISPTMNPIGYADVSADIDVVIKNYSSIETIDSLYIQLPDMGLGWKNYCGNKAVGGFHNLKLASGKTVTLHLGNLIKSRVKPGPAGYPFSITMNTFSPNGKLDMDSSNDRRTFIKDLSGIESAQNPLGNIKIYPNPTHSLVTISNPGNEAFKLVILNATGQEVFISSNQNPVSVIDVSGYPAGIYYIKVQTNNGIDVDKLIKD